MTFFQTRKRKGPPEALLKIIFGRRYIKPQIHVDLFRTRISERSAGGFAQIHLGQQYLRLRWELTLSTHKRRKGPLEVVPKFILGRNILASYWHLTLSKHKIWKDPPEALPKFILGRDDLSLKSVFDFFQTIKMEKSAGGSAQIYFGQKYLSLNRYLTFPNYKNGKVRRRLCPNLFWAEIIKPLSGI